MSHQIIAPAVSYRAGRHAFDIVQFDRPISWGRQLDGASRKNCIEAHVTNVGVGPYHGVLHPKNYRNADGCAIVSRMRRDVLTCESVKTLLAVQGTLLMLFGCVARPPAPAPHNVVTTANSTPAATTPARSANADSSADKANPAVNQALVKRGYQPRQINGQLKYCRSQVLTGTHFSQTVCLTQEQISATDGNTKSDLDIMDRAGRAICPNNKCD
jgi:hypothetical protein